MASFYLLDGHSLAYRAWFALQDAGMATTSGQQTQAVYGFVAMVTRLLADFHPDGLAVAFDRHEPTFRDAIASDYKAGRPPMPEPLAQQIELIGQFVQALGVPAFDAIGYEADDVIATLATRLAGDGQEVVIVTGDRDAFQLVEDPGIRVLYNRRGVTDYVLYDEAGIFERTGVQPSSYPLLAALRGDPSDNLPGVPGVGEKTAAKLVQSYGDVEGIYAHLDACTPKLRESLANSEAQVRRNLELIPVVRDVPLEFATDDLHLNSVDTEALDRLFSFLEMRTPRDRLNDALASFGVQVTTGEATAEQVARAVQTLGSPDEVASFLNDVAHQGEGRRVAIDALWSGDPGRSPIDLFVIAPSADGPIGVLSGVALEQEPAASALAALISGSGPRNLAMFRARELMRHFAFSGLDVTRLDVDGAIVSYLIDPANGSLSIDEIGARYGLFATSSGGARATGQLGFDLEQGASEEIMTRVAARADLIARLSDRLWSELEAVDGKSLYEDIERPLARVLVKMEVAGIAVDVDRLREINTELTEEAKRLEAEIHAHAGEVFNVNSTAQLRTVLYEKLKLTPQRKTKTGFSTDAATLEKLRDAHPVVEALLRYREVEKLRSTYGEGLLGEVASDGRIHATFNQTVARTGRLSSDQPNLHNIPVRSDEGRRFREAFVSKPGHELLVADYNQIELRVIAHLTNDPGLVAAFAEGRDIHNATAAAIFRVEPAEVTGQMRSKAKMVSYGLAYGMEAYGLAQRLGIGVEEASGILREYFVAFPAVRAYMDEIVALAKTRGYTETELGRRRYLPELSSDNFRVRQAAERQAMNAGIQGLAADIFKIALVRLDATLEEAGLSARIVLQVHDEVLVESALEDHERVESLTLSAMREAYALKVPLEVHSAWGTSWANAKQG